jgi:transcriptional regulator with XRE-family HTH domain
MSESQEIRLGPDAAALGRELRALRTAAGRTVASVAADAGLSVPYIANLENGRGNPTLAALGRLTTALGVQLTVSLAPRAERPGRPGHPAPADIPPSLARFARTGRFRLAVAEMAGSADVPADAFAFRLVAAFAAFADALGRVPAEADWLRLLDAAQLVSLHPAAGTHDR